MTSDNALHLFEATGIELEYMIVDQHSLDVRPITDEVLRSVAGSYESEVELGPISWSNELVLHVIELKTSGPARLLDPLPTHFQQHVGRINDILAGYQARLMPSAMHPWMDPKREMRLWPHDYSPVYQAYDRIFGCVGHGWSNLQSVHINLPFHGDGEFGRLHAAIRVLLPILPALAASSPVIERQRTGLMDSRLEVYRHNSDRIPSIAGAVIPEPVFTRADYHDQIFAPMYRDIAPLDPEGTLQHEFLNSRGAIARFERDSIEIRVLDLQECPEADLAIAAVIVAALRALVEQRHSSFDQQRSWAVEPLSRLFVAALREAEQAVIDDNEYLSLFGFPGRAPVRMGELWGHLIDGLVGERWRGPLQVIQRQGTLARRIVQALEQRAGSDHGLFQVYGQLCECLAQGTMFEVR